MAAVADVQLVNITVNDTELQVPKGEMIVESVKRLGLEIPIFCYHPRMKPVGMCRMCLIEIGFKQPDGSVRKMPKPQTACTLPASEGLVVYTDTPLLHNDRKGVLEFLLINHPLDCPICDRGGECPLQNNTLYYGPSTSRFVEFKRHASKAFPLSQYVTLDLERCIQCGRCVRFTEEISGDGQLALRFRGSHMQPGTFELRNFDSKFSGNVIEICPVGALTNSKYRFRARPWDIQTQHGICTECSNGCNIFVDYRGGEIARINGRTNEAVNEEWTCDRGKFGHYKLNADNRLGKVMTRSGNSLAPSTWAEAYAQILEAFSSQPADSIAALVGGTSSNEDLFALQMFFRKQLGTESVDHRFERHWPGSVTEIEAKIGQPLVKNAIADYEVASSVLVFGTSLADELPILFLRVRKGWLNNKTKVIVAHDTTTEVDSFADAILRYRPGTGHVLAQALAGVVTPEAAEAATGVPAALITRAVETLKGSLVVTTRGLYDLEDGAATVEALAAMAQASEGSFNCYARFAAEEGAALLGIAPNKGNGLGTHAILDACVSGSVKALWLVGVNPFETFHDHHLVRLALESVDFLVYQHSSECEALHYASVVLPMTAPTETEGSYVNMERRIQRFPQVLSAKGDAKPAWRVFSDLGARIRPQVPPFSTSEVLGKIAEAVPAFAGVSYEKLKGEGLLLR